MLQAGSWAVPGWRRSVAQKCARCCRDPLLLALMLSLGFHAGLFGVLELGQRLHWWEARPFRLMNRLFATPAAAARAREELADLAKPKPEAEEVPLVFVDVDTSQETADPVPETRYYGLVNTVAANPDTSRETLVPKLDGTQDRVLKTANTFETRDVPVPPPTVEPLQPAEQPELNRELAEVQPRPASGETLGDLAMAKPLPEAVPERPGPPVEARPATPRRQFRSVAEARARVADQSTLRGEKLRQDGGVGRFSLAASLNVRSSRFADYDAAVIRAVQDRWFSLLSENRFALDRSGKVVLDFRLNSDGRITDLTVAESDVGQVFTVLCERAVTDPAKYAPWPADMVKTVGATYREVRFTFFYD